METNTLEKQKIDLDKVLKCKHNFETLEGGVQKTMTLNCRECPLGMDVEVIKYGYREK